MKKRFLSLALALSLLFSLSLSGPLSAAEEPSETAESVAEPVAVASEEMIEEPAEAEAPEEELIDDAPSTQAPPAEPADAPDIEPAEEIVEEPVVTDAPEIEPEEVHPVVDAADPEPSEAEDSTQSDPAAEDAPEAPEMFAYEESVEADDLHSVPALGSDGVEYADVAYLSQAAFNSLSERQQDDYVQMVDVVTEMLDDGTGVTNIVFSLDEEGTLGFNYAIPTEMLTDGALDAQPVWVVEEEYVQDAPEEVEAESEVAAEPEAAQEQEPEPVVENVELAESVAVPLVKIGGARSSGIASISTFGMRSINTLSASAEGENYFYNQLSDGAKEYYTAGKNSIVNGGSNGFVIEHTKYMPVDTLYMVDAFSALILNYPESFDWMAAGGLLSYGYASYSTGDYRVQATLQVSPHYNSALETQARNKVSELVSAARKYASENYPNDIEYGIIKYLDDWICRMNYYNNVGTAVTEAARESEAYYYCHSSYGTLLKGYGVCESYARAMSRLLDAAGIPNIYVVGDAGGGHAWNHVRMSDGKYYMVDSTWNDPGWEGAGSTTSYLLCEKKTNHTPTGSCFTSGNSFNFPELSATRYVYKQSAASATATPEIAPAPTHPLFEPVKVQSIVLNLSALSMKPGESKKLIAGVSPTNATTKVVKWTSDRAEVATVGRDGTVVAAGNGKATITCAATDGSGVTATCAVTVSDGSCVPLTEIRLSRSTLSMIRGNGAILTPSFTPAEATNKAVTWSSDNRSVATVEGGEIRAVGVGSATITCAATDGSGVRATCAVTVSPIQVSRISLSKAKLALEKGASEKLTTTILPTNADDRSVEWASDGDSVATVGQDGTVRAVGVGSAKITCTAKDGSGRSAECTVTVTPVMVKKIALSETSLALTKGDTRKLTATVEPRDAENQTLNWMISGSDVVSIESDGTVTAVGVGAATIICGSTDGSGVSATCAITVAEARPTRILLNATKYTLGAQDRLQLVPTIEPGNAVASVTYSSSNRKVATVDEHSGLVTAVAKGTATITARTDNGKTAKCAVTVKSAPTKVTLNRSALELSVGEKPSEKLKATLSSNSASTLTWISSAPDVAAVDAGGNVTAVGAGTATITVSTHNYKPEAPNANLIKYCTVTVKPDPISISGVPDSVALGKGEALQLAAVAKDEAGEATLAAFGYGSSGANIAAVSATGKITAKNVGAAEIAVKTKTGVTATVQIEVKPAPGKNDLRLGATGRTLGVGESFELTATLAEGRASKLTASTSNGNIAAVREIEPGRFLVTTSAARQKTGTATITVRTFNKVSKTCKITVKKAPTEAGGMLTVKPAALTLAEKQAATLSVSYRNGFGGGCSWSVIGGEDGGEATVENGKLTAVKAGTVTVLATSYNGAAVGRCAVTVEPEPKVVELNATEIELGLKETFTLAPVAKDGEIKVTKATFSYESDAPLVASVDQKGKITAKKAGEATVTARAYNGVTAELHVTVKSAPTAVRILNNPATLGVGEAWTLGAEIVAKDKKGQVLDCAGGVTFSTNNRNVLDVNPRTGALTAKRAGKSARITARAYNGKSASVTIAVRATPTEIHLDRGALTMGVGEPKIRLTASFAPRKNQYGHVTWTSDEESVVAVNNGALTAVSEGTATVTANVYHVGGEPYAARCTVTVKAAPTPEAMHLALPKTTVGIGESIAASFAYDEGTAGAYEFRIDKVGRTAYATVNGKTGAIKGAKVGTAQVYVRAYNGATTEPQTITIVAKPTSVSLLNKVAKLGVGEHWQLGAKVSAKAGKVTRDVTDQVKYSFSSSKPQIVHVDEQTGELTAGALPAGKSSASAKITVRAYNGKAASTTITVVAAPKGASLNKSALTLAEGQSEKLSVAYAPSNSFGNVVWSSDDGQVATVSAGKVTAVRAGTARITAKIYNQEPLVCEVTVKPAPRRANATLVPAKAKIGVGESTQLHLDYDGPANVVTGYKSSNNKIATVSAKGVVKGVKAGRVTITAVTYNDRSLALGEKIAVEIEVVRAPTGLTIVNVPEGRALAVGETWTPEFRIAGYGGESEAGLVTGFVSGNTRVAKFDRGVLKAIAKGTAKITCKTYNGKSVSFVLTVVAAGS